MWERNFCYELTAYILHCQRWEKFLSRTHIPALGKDKNWTATRWPHVYRDVIVEMTSPCRIWVYSGFFWKSFPCFFQYEWGIKWWARKRIHYSCEGGIEKYVLRAHWLSSLLIDSYNRTYPYQPVGMIINEQPHAGRTSTGDVIVMLKLRHHVASQRIHDFLEVIFLLF